MPQRPSIIYLLDNHPCITSSLLLTTCLLTLGSHKRYSVILCLFEMATPPTRKQWAKPEDWERVKPLIRELYKDELKPLKEVIAIMEKEHHFFAT